MMFAVFSEVGLWNPELWINNVWHSESPLEGDRGQQGDRRPLRTIGDNLRRRGDVVLGPQRRSFNQGCQVKQQQQQQQIRSVSPTENMPAAQMIRSDSGRGGGAYRMADRQQQQAGVRRNNADFQPNWRDRDPGAMDRIGDRFRRFGVCI